MYPNGVTVSIAYTVLDQITSIVSSGPNVSYSLEYTYHPTKDYITQITLKQDGNIITVVERGYDEARRIVEEKVTKGGNVVFWRTYQWDKVFRRKQMKDELSGWFSDFSHDASGRLLQIVNTPGTGANPFPWPEGVTNVTNDANGNILQMSGTGWQVSHEFDYEQRVKRMVLSNGDVVENIFDGMGRRVKEITTPAGGSPQEKRFILAAGNVVQERDASDNVTARYFWADGNLVKKDTGDESLYIVPGIYKTPFSAWNSTGAFLHYDLWDGFGLKVDESSSGRFYPFELRSRMKMDASHLFVEMSNFSYYAEIGRQIQGKYLLAYQQSGCLCEGRGCPICAVTFLDGCACIDPTPDGMFCVYCSGSGGGGGNGSSDSKEIFRTNDPEAALNFAQQQQRACGCLNGGGCSPRTPCKRANPLCPKGASPCICECGGEDPCCCYWIDCIWKIPDRKTNAGYPKYCRFAPQFKVARCLTNPFEQTYKDLDADCSSCILFESLCQRKEEEDANFQPTEAEKYCCRDAQRTFEKCEKEMETGEKICHIVLEIACHVVGFGIIICFPIVTLVCHVITTCSDVAGGDFERCMRNFGKS